MKEGKKDGQSQIHPVLINAGVTTLQVTNLFVSLYFSLITHAHKIVNKEDGSNKIPRPAFLSLSFLDLPKK